MGGVDWGMFLTIFLAIVVARIASDILLSKGSNSSSSTQVSAVTRSPAEPVVVYANPIDEHIAKYYPNARR